MFLQRQSAQNLDRAKCSAQEHHGGTAIGNAAAAAAGNVIPRCCPEGEGCTGYDGIRIDPGDRENEGRCLVDERIVLDYSPRSTYWRWSRFHCRPGAR